MFILHPPLVGVGSFGHSRDGAELLQQLPASERPLDGDGRPARAQPAVASLQDLYLLVQQVLGHLIAAVDTRRVVSVSWLMGEVEARVILQCGGRIFNTTK